MEIEKAHEALGAFVFFPVVETVDAMEAGEDAVLPGMVGGAVFGEDDAAGRIMHRVEIGAGVGLHDVGGEMKPIAAVGGTGANEEFAGTFFELNAGFRGGSGSDGEEKKENEAKDWHWLSFSKEKDSIKGKQWGGEDGCYFRWVGGDVLIGMTMSDMELVREYARSKSEEAFAALVSRHVNLVYSVALRQVRDAHLAEEVTQTVFVILARKAASIKAATVVSGWLCQTARYASAKAVTMRQRREQRENEAYMQSSTNDDAGTANAWMQIEPLLENALGELSQKDHDALVVRYLEGRSFKEVSTALGTTEAGAKMRVNRALEKLRGYFSGRGISLSAAVIAGAVSAHSVQAAPAGLAASATVAAIGGTAVASSTATLINTTLKYMAWTKVKTATAISAVALFTIGTGTVISQKSDPKPAAAVEAKGPSYKTPEDTMKSIIAALEAADTVKFAAACTPERAAQFNAQNEGKTAEELEREAHGMAKAFSSFKIVSRKAVSDSEVHMHIKALGDTSRAQSGDTDLMVRFKKVGSDWKFDGHVR